MCGFVGIAFHTQKNASHFECFYLGPNNGRADDQLRRNHVTQYVSHPDFPWRRLREEAPVSDSAVKEFPNVTYVDFTKVNDLRFANY